jgi:hypothetical protein
MTNSLTQQIDAIYISKINELKLENYNIEKDHSKVPSDKKLDLAIKYQDTFDINNKKIENIKNELDNKIDIIMKLNTTTTNQETTLKTNKEMNVILDDISKTQEKENQKLKQKLSFNKDDISTINKKLIHENKKKNKFIKQIKILSIILIILIVIYLFLL